LTVKKASGDESKLVHKEQTYPNEISIDHGSMSISAIVIDDDKDLKDIFVELLQINNMNIVGTGNNGKQAFELYQKHKPDIVFMDVMMPEYDGLYGLKNIREYDPNAVIVLVTGSANVGNKLDNCKATAILPKPIDMDKIKSIVNRFCIQ
jgi:two-component system chemotaxis response regulator CheY